MSVECVVHVYDRPAQDQYSKLFCLQAASLIRWPPKCLVRLTVIHGFEADDPLTYRRVQAWNDDGVLAGSAGIMLRMVQYSKPSLFRRAIGRDFACQTLLQETTAVWMADADSLWGEGCLDAVNELAKQKAFDCGYPARYMISRDHALGDQRLAECPEPPDIATIDLNDFDDVRGRPIGGLMILRGDIAREGYLRNHEKWQQPIRDKDCFSFRCDIAHRKEQSAKGRHYKGLPIPNYLRARHSIAADGSKVKTTTNADGRLVPIQ